MARKSRKPNNKVEIPNLESSLIQVAAYIRLSLEDRAQKGSSIESQQRIILNYIDEHPDFELHDTYIDAGVSGTTFERPSFQRIMRDAEAGKISCIIVKDLSRLWRNLIDTGYYVEKLFPSLGIRLISINDNYDTDADSGGIMMPIINLVNEAYALDISRKTRSQKRQAMKDGVYVGGRPPYGYAKSPDDRHKLIVDAFAAEVVTQIFMWAASNVSMHNIVRRLNSLKIPSPNAHWASLGASREEGCAKSGVWHVRTIERILKNEIYLGHLIQGKTKVINFSRQAASTDEWIYTYNTHKAIVSAELFQASQPDKCNNQNENISKKPKISHPPNIFKGKIYCAHCGRFMERTKRNGQSIYRCVTKRIAPDLCEGNYIGEDAVKEAVFEKFLQYKEKLVIDINAPFIGADIIPELQYVEMELSHAQEITRGLYENWVNGVIDKKDYIEFKAHYQKSVNDLRHRADELKQKINDEKRLKTTLQESLCILNELTDATMLTKEHIERFIDRIEVLRDGRVYVKISDHSSVYI